MVRTTQTASKTTGGTAPRIAINNHVKSAITRLPSRIPTTKPTDAVTEAVTRKPAKPEPLRPCFEAMLSRPWSRGGYKNNDFCHFCQDGGHLFSCDSCPRAACFKCIRIPHEHTSIVAEGDVTYLCVACHWKDDALARCPTPYKGFYKDGKAVLPTFPLVDGHFELSVKSFIHNKKTVILHLRLRSIPPGGPINILKEFLQPYFTTPGDLTVIDVEFDLGTTANRKAYGREASTIASNIRAINAENVLVTITNHTDEGSGDLFLGKLRKKDVSATVTDFMDTLLSPFRSEIGGAMLFLLACGSIVRKSESYEALLDMVGRFGFSSAIAFDAQHLQPLATWAFLATLTEAVFIEGHRADDAIPHALGHSNRLGPHSGVYLITLSPTTSETQKIVNVTKYIWSHRDYRPWGTTLPVQCRECGTPQQWAGTKCSDNYTFECRYEFCGWDPVCQEFVKPRGTYVVEKPEGMQVIPNGKLPSSSWLRFCLPAKVIEADSEDLAMELD